MRIEQLLKDSYAEADSTTVTLTLTTTIGELRSASDAFDHATLVSAKLGVAAVKRTPAKKTTAKKATTQKAAPKRKTAASRKPASAASKPTSAAAAKAKASKPAATPKPKAAAQSASAGRVKQEAVIAAIRDGHKTPAAIAKAVNGDQRQVSKALSRYAKAGLVTREGTGIYGIAAA